MALRPTRFFVTFAVLYVTCIAASGQTPVTPTTTLAAETANNTSASNTFQRQPNGNIGAGNISKLPVRALLYSGSTTTVLAHVMAWFGDSQHMDVGYTSSDAAQIHKQVSDMLSRGIGGVVLDWDGPQRSLSTNTVAGFRTEAETRNGTFTFAVIEDVESVVAYSQQNGCDVTQKIIDDLNYAYTNFEISSAYMHQNGRPVVLFFGTEAYYIDWNKVRDNISGNPVLVFRNHEAFGLAQADGAFSWMNITDGDPNNQDLAGLDGLYSTAQQNPAKLVIGGAWKGFNDTLAAWSSNRIINQQCGKTWLATLAEAGNYYSSSNQLPFLQLVTWNDYEEGTEIETGIDNCVSVSESIQGSTLQWDIGANGNENAVSAYRVFISTDSPSAPNPGLMPLVDVAAATHSLDLSQYSLATATYTLYVEALGKATIANHMSRAVTYRPGHQPPTVSVSASPSTGTAPVTVTATVTASAASGSSIAGTSIDFGDGAIMNGSTASHQYGNAGTYTITATATDTLGVSSSSTTTVTVTASASYGVVISSPAAGNTNNQFVEVKATATTPNPPITAIWVYVDNQLEYQSSNQSSIDASLKLNNGSHHIVVQAWDWTGALFVGDVYINVLAPPSTLSAVLDVTQLPSVGKYGVMACTARSTDTNGFVTSSAVDFGDGTTAGGTTTYHNYGAAGTYTVKTTVTDDHGYTSSASTNVTVSGVADMPPIAVLSVNPTSGPAPLTVTVSTSGSSDPDGTISSSRIDFGDGTVVNGASAQHTYANVGTYTVTGTVTDNAGLSSQATASVQVATQPPAPTHDFSGSGKSGILWRNSSTGSDAIWLMNGGIVASNLTIWSVPDTNWKIVGVGDFDGDGKADILWRNSSTGQDAIWLMNGGTVASNLTIWAVPDTNWQVAGVADFNGDGKADILWRNSGTGQDAIWLMNGGVVASNLTIWTVPDLNWSIAGVGDFDGDGKADILWRNSNTGSDAIWLMNAGTVASNLTIWTVPDTNWKVAGVGDFDGDGKADILWRNSINGQDAIWLMNSGTVVSNLTIWAVSDLTLQVAGVGDFNGDGKSDILWRNSSTGSDAIWLMNGGTVSSNLAIWSVPDLNWNTQPHPGQS